MNKTPIIIWMSIVGLLYLTILIWGYKVLLSETKINPWENYYVEDYGDLWKSEQSSLVCSYFNWRKILQTVFWYSPNNIMGKDSCPFVYE